MGKVRKILYRNHECSVARKVVTPDGEKLLICEQLILPNGRYGAFTTRGLIFGDSTTQLVQLLRAHLQCDRVLIAMTTTLS